jgi:hypothetical protein
VQVQQLLLLDRWAMASGVRISVSEHTLPYIYPLMCNELLGVQCLYTPSTPYSSDSSRVHHFTRTDQTQFLLLQLLKLLLGVLDQLAVQYIFFLQAAFSKCNNSLYST